MASDFLIIGAQSPRLQPSRAVFQAPDGSGERRRSRGNRSDLHPAKGVVLRGMASIEAEARLPRLQPRRAVFEAPEAISLSNYSSFEGVLYCKPHFDQLFKMTGSLEKSFEGAPRISRAERSMDQTRLFNDTA